MNIQRNPGKKPGTPGKKRCIYTGYRRVNIKVVENSVEKVEKSAEIRKEWWITCLLSSTGKEKAEIYVNLCRYPELNVVWSAPCFPVKTGLWKTRGTSGRAGFDFIPAARACQIKNAINWKAMGIKKAGSNVCCLLCRSDGFCRFFF